MKHLYFFLFLCILGERVAIAQETVEISFKSEKVTVNRGTEAYVYPVVIKADLSKIPEKSRKHYTITAKVNEKKSTLPRSGYELSFKSVALDKLSNEYTLFLTVKPDTLPDRDRNLYLYLEIAKNDTLAGINIASTNLEMDIKITGARALNKYNYLGYIGTNFDLVDGVQAKNLFFATSIFMPPQLKGFGFNLSLYGNRAVTLTDTSGRVRYASKIVPLPGDSARTYYEEALKTRTKVTDNLGASFSPLIRLGSKMSNPNQETQLYYAPQFEFIWRRNALTTTYSDITLSDSTDRANRPISKAIQLTPAKEIIPFNVYDVYLGLAGLLLKHENSDISVRVQASTGVNYSYAAIRDGKKEILLTTPYDREWNFFFFARAWITEPKSGLTFGAEVSNNFIKKNSHQPYFNVTLSKALNLSALSGVFSSVSSK